MKILGLRLGIKKYIVDIGLTPYIKLLLSYIYKLIANFKDKGEKIMLQVLVVIILIICVLAIIPPRTPKIKRGRKIIAESVAEIKKIRIGGVEQSILIRGNNINNPVILFLHGGPGNSEIGYIRKYQKRLEEKFVVVRWDQRGAGASFSKIPKDSFTIEQFLNDVDEVSDYLIRTFNKNKIFIIGHSWGTVLATLSVKNNPHKYLTYISVGQFVNMRENEQISYEFALTKAKEVNDKKALKDLACIEEICTYKNMLKSRKYVDKFGGTIKTVPKRGLGTSLLLSTEYKFFDKLNYPIRAIKSSRLMYDELFKINLMTDVKELEIPTYFIMGKYDYTTVYPLAEAFYKQLKAPIKELLVFENSAHLPQLEEEEKFNDTLIRILNNRQRDRGDH